MLRPKSRSSQRQRAIFGLTFSSALLLLLAGVQAQEAAADRVRPESKVNRLLNALDQDFAQNRYSDSWAQGLREIVGLGHEAVPDLITELNATDSDIMLRNLGFMLRAIGDKRAIPALIRAFPKTLRKPGSDMGLRSGDPELLAFMQKHDLSATDRDNMYSFGRPVREIGAALQKLSGVEHGEDEIYGVFLQGGAVQQHMQRQLYHKCAQRWVTWWEKNWQQHVSDKNYAFIRLPPEDPPPAKSFPSGPGVKIVGGGRGHIVEADDDPDARREVFFDLDTGRKLGLPEQLRALKDDPNRFDKIQDWAAREGFDLMGTSYQPAGTDKRFYAIRGLGLTAWEIDAARYGAIGSEIRNDAPIVTGRPAGGLLLHYDADRGEYDPTATAAFLFLTRETTYGVLFVGVEVLDTNVKIGVPSRDDPALNPVGFYKGRRFNFRTVDSGEGSGEAN